MEPITLCGAVIVLFGLWVEFEPRVVAVVRWISEIKFFAEIFPQSTARRPVYVRKLPICLAKTFHY
jgi:hypothetical protein